MMSLTEQLKQALAIKEEKKERRVLQLRTQKIDFASNDYLSLARSGLENFSFELNSFGATGSPLLTGHSPLAEDCVRKLSSFFASDSALLFPSGYQANCGIIPALCGRSDLILADDLVHASMKDGIKLSASESYYFRHNDINHLEEKLIRLKKKKDWRQIYILLESLYSMDGDLCPLEEATKLAEKYQAYIILDEAHSIATLGRGRGLASELNLCDKVLLRLVTFGKALGGQGACVLASQLVCDYLSNFCRSFIYSTALPQTNLYWVLSVLSLLEKERKVICSLQEKVRFFSTKIGKEAHFGPIFTCFFKGRDELHSAYKKLLAEDILALPIYSPTVRRGTERLRICLHAHNSYEEICKLLKVLETYETTWSKSFHNRN